MEIEKLLGMFTRRAKAGTGWNVQCPVHEDRQASLSITEKSGKILLHCHAGCATKDILEKLGIALRDLFLEPQKQKERVTDTYQYTDENGKLLYEVCRWFPKKFTCRRPRGSSWVNNLEGVERVPYHLPEIVKSKDIILIVEGEKDVETARALGFVATCNSGGAGKWKAEWSKYFEKRIVYIIPDSDGPGQIHAQFVATQLKNSTKFIVPLHEHKDLTDWAPTREQLLDLLNDAKPWDETQIVLGYKDMPDVVLSGRLGEILQKRMARFPISYAWLALVAVAGTIVRRASSTLRQNLFCALVGPVHSGKTQAIEQATKILGLKSPDLVNVMAGSAEGLLGRLKTANGCARLVSMDELGHMLAKSHIENASFPYILNRAFYATQFELTIAKQKGMEFNCEMGLLGGCVSQQFDSLFDASTVGGLYDRFIFGMCPEPFEYSYRPLEGESEEVPETTAITVHRDVWAAKDEWVREGMSPRVAENALRVAGICCAYDGFPQLEVKHLAPAKALGEYLMRVRMVLRPNPGENPDAKCAFAIMGLLNGEWVAKRDIYRTIHAYRMGPSVFKRALDNLTFNEELEIKTEGTQKAAFYRRKDAIL